MTTQPHHQSGSAACAGEWALFDSVLAEDHKMAAAMCAACPVLLSCRDLLRSELAIGRTLRSAGGGPRGTWAGKLIGPKVQPTARCATDSGYFRHRRLGEDVCDECRIAHRLANAGRVAAS